MIACLRIPSFAALLLHRNDRSLARRPVLLYETIRGRDCVAVACPTARRRGVRPGMTLATALACCPTVVLRALDPVLLQAGASDLASGCATLTPRWQLAELRPDLVLLLDLGRGRYGDAVAGAAQIRTLLLSRGWPAAHIGLAATPTLARLAADVAPGDRSRIVPPVAVPTLLAECAPSLLPALLPIAERLRALGLRNLADLAALPAAAVVAQFGSTALKTWHALHGREDPLPPAPLLQPPLLRVRRRFAGPIGERHLLHAALPSLLQRLSEAMLRRGYQTRRIGLVLHTEAGDCHQLSRCLSPPAAGMAALAPPAGALLDNCAVLAGVECLELVAAELLPARAEQAALLPLVPVAPTADLPDELAARYGTQVVVRAVWRNPSARLAEERIAFKPWGVD